MPTKTIYISDDDQSLFSEAQEYADGNVSAAIIKGLKLFTAQQAASKEGFMQQTIDIREDGASKKKHFMGRKLASVQLPEDGGARVTKQRIYKTQKGAYLLYTRTSANWQRFAEWWDDPENWQEQGSPAFDGETTSQYIVCKSLDELKQHGASDKLIDSARSAESEPDEEYLDI